MAAPAPSPIRPSPRRDRWRETTLPITLLIGDAGVTFAGLCLGYLLRYESPVGRMGLEVTDVTFPRYLPLLLVGVGLLLASFVQFGLYDTRLLLRRYQNLNAILKGASVWLVAYLGLSLVLKFDPPISRLFVLLAFAAVVVLLYAWRSLVYALLARTAALSRLRRRAVILGWNEEARTLADEIARDPSHPSRSPASSRAPTPRPPLSPHPRLRRRVMLQGTPPPSTPPCSGRASSLPRYWPTPGPISSSSPGSTYPARSCSESSRPANAPTSSGRLSRAPSISF